MRGLFRWSIKWWPGVIPLAVLWAFAAWNVTGPLEADLAARSGAALKDITLDKTRIAVAGRDVTLDAEAFSVDGRQSAVASVDAVPGVRLVNDETDRKSTRLNSSHFQVSRMPAPSRDEDRKSVV